MIPNECPFSDSQDSIIFKVRKHRRLEPLSAVASPRADGGLLPKDNYGLFQASRRHWHGGEPWPRHTRASHSAVNWRASPPRQSRLGGPVRPRRLLGGPFPLVPLCPASICEAEQIHMRGQDLLGHGCYSTSKTAGQNPFGLKARSISEWVCIRFCIETADQRVGLQGQKGHFPQNIVEGGTNSIGVGDGS
jgi:hypothetical protein